MAFPFSLVNLLCDNKGIVLPVWHILFQQYLEELKRFFNDILAG